VIAPSGPVPRDTLERGLARLAPHFSLRVADDIHRVDGFLAGSDERRAEELNAALRDPDIRGIWMARGGYGVSRLLDDLDGAALRADPIPVVGFSDGTALLSWVAHQGFRCVHGPTMTQLGSLPDAEVQEAVSLAGGGAWGSALAGPPLAALAGRSLPLVGGNLSVLAHLCGTRFAMSFRDALVVVEDVGERPYALDRYLSQLIDQQSEALTSARALLLGELTRCVETKMTQSPDAEQTLLARARKAGIEAAAGWPVGHGETNRAWVFGARCAVDDQGALRPEQGLCDL
jgi:muramoyltetrapeptide carboxypeptidase